MPRSQLTTNAPEPSAPTAEAATVLLIEDDLSIQRLVRLYLEQAGFAVLVAGDGRTGLELYDQAQPAFVVLDLMLPRLDGWQVCQRIRATGGTPILMLTARRTEEDRLRGFDLGADDYLMKPFSPRELVSRVRAILRRVPPAADAAGGASATPEQLSFGALTVWPAQRRVEVEGERVELRAKEFDLLLAFARSPERVATREDLLRRVWGFEFLGDSRTVDVHVGMLRKKIERDPSHPGYIKTVRGVGYLFDPSGAPADGEGG